MNILVLFGPQIISIVGLHIYKNVLCRKISQARLLLADQTSGIQRQIFHRPLPFVRVIGLVIRERHAERQNDGELNVMGEKWKKRGGKLGRSN